MPVRVFLLTGCASGIGQEIAKFLLKKNECVCAVDINTPGLSPLKAFAQSEDQLLLAELNITNADQWEGVLNQIIKKWGRLDCVMNIAAIPHKTDIFSLTSPEIDRIIDINFKGIILGTQIPAKFMRQLQSPGQIINFASIAAYMPLENRSLYAACKAAVRNFSLSAALQFEKYNIKVTVVCLSAYDTPMLREGLNDAESAYEFVGLTDLNILPELIWKKVVNKNLLEVALLKRYAFFPKLLNNFPSIAIYKAINKLSMKAGKKIQEKMRKNQV